MSSAVAMNRRVARQTNNTVQEFDRQTDQNRQQRPRQAKGTPAQQCWTVLNFHETRLKTKYIVSPLPLKIRMVQKMQVLKLDFFFKEWIDWRKKMQSLDKHCKVILNRVKNQCL